MLNKIFGYDIEEVRRQCSVKNLSSDFDLPLTSFETLEPAIKGGNKILTDTNLSVTMKEIYCN